MENETKTGFSSRDQLRQLLIQIHLMKSYATEQGMRVSSKTATQLAELSLLTEAPLPAQSPVASGTSAQNSPESQEVAEIKRIGEALKVAFEVHASLSELVKPATPDSLEASKPRKGWRETFRSPRVTDILALTTTVGVILLLLGAALVNRDPQNSWSAQVYYLGSALLGASFSGLYIAFKYISNRTFDPACASSYWTRVLLGTASGVILANFGQSFIGTPTTTTKAIGPAALGLLGGYSADAVNLILRRVADTLVAAVRGDGDEALKAKQLQLEAESKANEVKQRQATAAELTALLGSTQDEATKAAIQRLLSALTKGEDVSGTIKPPEEGETTSGSSTGSGSGSTTSGSSGPVTTIEVSTEPPTGMSGRRSIDFDLGTTTSGTSTETDPTSSRPESSSEPET